MSGVLLEIGFVRRRLFHLRSISVIHGNLGLRDLQHFGVQFRRPRCFRQTPKEIAEGRSLRQGLDVQQSHVLGIARIAQLGKVSVSSMFLFLHCLRFEVGGIGVNHDQPRNLVHVQVRKRAHVVATKGAPTRM